MTPSRDPSRSFEIEKLVLALSKAQGAIGDIPRNRTVTVRPKSGGQEYSFKYATLSAIIEAIKKPLADNGLAYTQVISHDADGGFYVLTTTLYHGNQFLSSKVPLITEGATNQQFGSALTYMKRYALAAMLGIAADEDDDGNAADGNEIKGITEKGFHGELRNPAPKAPAPDPISTGKRPTEELKKPIYGDAAVLNDTGFGLLPVPLLKDDSGSDWMAWGQTFMGLARSAPDAKTLALLEKNNAMPMKNMEVQAPKMFTNMTLALLKVRKELEKTNAG